MAKREDKKKNVTLIEDPFGLNTIEISEAQQNTEELTLDEDLIVPTEGDVPADSTTDDSQLASIAEAMAKIETEMTEELTEAQAMSASEELAAQIAEDQALAAELAKEIESEPESLATDEEGNLDVNELESCLEALLFMVDKPVSLQKLRELVGGDFKLSLFQEAMTSLRDRYKASHHGIEVAEVGGGFQFRTKPSRASLAKKLAKIQSQRLSTGAMETLAIVAYRQPVLKEEIDKIRGVDSSYFIHGLLEKKLLKISGRSELPGRPMLYATTDEFLQLFGLKDLAAMPSLRELEQMIPASESANPEEEDPRIREMRKLVGDMKSDKSTSLLYDPKEDEKILKEIRERVTSISTSTPTLDEQRAQEKEKLAQAELPAEAVSVPPTPAPVESIPEV